MFRFLIFLLGTALLGAIMAAVYYSPDNIELRETSGAFNPGAGEVRIDGVPPSDVKGSSIYYEVTVLAGEVDIYVMDDEWADALAEGGQFRLDRPFSYYREWSATHVNVSHSFTIISDAKTSYVVAFDNSDNYYAGDAGENGSADAQLQVTARYVEQEDRSLTFGYLASIPSILLVAVTFGRSYMRWRREKGLVPPDPSRE